ncbi:MAG: dehypoxanthine futalosine cyclase [Nitrospirae bacterium]|nr:dehypoxanthine futalosine cyclase [Nitrospirota bacterium]
MPVCNTIEKLEAVIDKIKSGQRISEKEALILFEDADLLTLGEFADNIRKRLHPDNIVTFVVDRNINYTNICINKCSFCAFYRNQADKDSYILNDEEIYKKINEAIALGATQILLQGGLHPEFDINYFECLFKKIKERFKIQLHALSPPEVYHIARQSGLSIKETITRLKTAGLDSIPGGGAEILVDRVRKQVSPKKINSEEWAEAMIEAHKLGLPTTATMMFGSIETTEEIIKHLLLIRNIQDKTKGFTAFIPWSFQPGNTKLGSKGQGSSAYTATGVEYLKILALSRIFLDNFKNIQASWVTQGAKLAQVALRFGANDMGSTMIEENVVAAAGVAYRISKEEIIGIIKDAGFTPCQRDNRYNILKTFPLSPLGRGIG